MALILVNATGSNNNKHNYNNEGTDDGNSDDSDNCRDTTRNSRTISNVGHEIWYGT